jgi:uncharacterized protein (UPF0335 family)
MIGAISKQQLQGIVQRIEKLEEEKVNLATDIKEVYAEAKCNGYDIKIIKQIIKMRKKDKSERDEEQALLETYMSALGMLPLFDSEED